MSWPAVVFWISLMWSMVATFALAVWNAHLTKNKEVTDASN